MSKVDVSSMVPIQDLPSDPHDERSLRNFAKTAESFLLSESWCDRVNASYLGYGVDGILGVFLFEIVPTIPEADYQLWVIVGDIPPAIIPCSNAATPSGALEQYIYEMALWVEAVQSGQPTDDLIPVCYQDSRNEVEPTVEFAEKLGSRLGFIEQEVIPDAKSQKE